MFTVYSEKEIFENIVVFNDKTPNWYKIFCHHSDVCLNMTEAELKAEEKQGTPIFEFILSNGGRSPIPLKSYFNQIYQDNSLVINNPRSVFFLDISPAVANNLQESFGVIVQSAGSINDNILTGTSYKELPLGSIIGSTMVSGWKTLFNFTLPPCNSLVISDDYLFSHEHRGRLIGSENFISIVDAVLPAKFGDNFQILVIADDCGRSDAACAKIAGDLKARIIALRSYPITFELVFTDTLHKRKMFSNYLSITCDKGFEMFDIEDNITVRVHNDFRHERSFTRNDPSEGETVFSSDEKLLQQIKAKCNSVKQYINNNHQDANRRILCDCRPDKSIRNRLLNDV